MRLDIPFNLLAIVLKSKTLVKILRYVLIEYDKQGGGSIHYVTTLENLRKSLGYKNKSTVSRGLTALYNLGICEVSTNKKGIDIYFPLSETSRI